MANTVQILEDYWKEHPAWFGRPYGEYLHLGANQEMLRLLLRDLAIDESWRVLDLGCALGGNARWIASLHGSLVDGVDTFRPAIVAARQLAKTQGLSERCRFQVGNVEPLPFSDDIFNLVITAEGEIPWAEVSRVVKPGGLFAGSAAASEGLEAFGGALQAHGFSTRKLIDVSSYALAFYRAKEQEARLLVEGGLMREADLYALQMHTVDLYEAGGASHALFLGQRSA